MTMQSYLASMEEWCPGYVGSCVCVHVLFETVGMVAGCWYVDPGFLMCLKSQRTWKPRLSFSFCLYPPMIK